MFAARTVEAVHLGQPERRQAAGVAADTPVPFSASTGTVGAIISTPTTTINTNNTTTTTNSTNTNTNNNNNNTNNNNTNNNTTTSNTTTTTTNSTNNNTNTTNDDDAPLKPEPLQQPPQCWADLRRRRRARLAA